MTIRTNARWVAPWALCIACGSAAKPSAEASAPLQNAQPQPTSVPLTPARATATEPALSDEGLVNRARADAAVRFDGTVYHDVNANPLVTACVPSGPERCGDGVDNDCDGRYDDVGCGYRSGVLQWTLTWDGDADLNLVVYGPAGDAISAAQPGSTASHVTLDRTCAGNCAPNIENAFVVADGAPLSGTYQASVEVNRAAVTHPRQPIHGRISGRVGKTTWHTDIALAPFSGAEYRTAIAIGVDSDADGIIDERDSCPQEQGCWFAEAKYRGCADRDADGVPDSIDACPLKTGLSTDDPKRNGCPIEFGDAWVTNGGVQIRKRIEFGTGTAELRADSMKLIESVARAIKSRPGAVTRMAIDGHTDGVGDETDNVDLSFRRAAAVATELYARGVPGELLEARGLGETRPLADNETEAGRQTNRRVEFVILQPPPPNGVCWSANRPR